MNAKAREQEILSLTKELIRIPSVTNNLEGRAEVVAYVEKFFRAARIPVQKFTHKGFTTLLIGNTSKKHVDLLLLGHLDVVPGPENIFTPKIHEGKLYGRGAADMKGADAVMMVLMRELLKEKKKTDLTVRLALTTDEEIGGTCGGKELIRRGYTAKLVLVPDGGRSLSLLVNSARGIEQFIVRSLTKGGSTSSFDKNAIDELISFYTDFREQLEQFKKYDMHVNLGKMQGGEAVNSAAQKCEMFFDLRFSKPKEGANIMKLAERVAKIHGVDLERKVGYEPTYTTPTHPYLRLYSEIVESILGKAPTPYQQKGTHDGRYFASKGTPVIATRPNSDHFHADDEWVDIQALPLFYRILSLFIEKFQP